LLCSFLQNVKKKDEIFDIKSFQMKLAMIRNKNNPKLMRCWWFTIIILKAMIKRQKLANYTWLIPVSNTFLINWYFSLLPWIKYRPKLTTRILLISASAFFFHRKIFISHIFASAKKRLQKFIFFDLVTIETSIDKFLIKMPLLLVFFILEQI